MERFSVSLPDKLLADFDLFLAKRGYENRSEAIRDLIRAALIREEWASDEQVVGVISMVFDHHQRQLQDRITDIQHDYGDIVISATHVHLDHHNCLEVVIVKGRAIKIQEMADRVRAVRGIKDASLNMSSTGKSLS